MDSTNKRMNQTATAPVVSAVMVLALVACSSNQDSDRLEGEDLLEITILSDGRVLYEDSIETETLDLPDQFQALDLGGSLACAYVLWTGQDRAMKSAAQSLKASATAVVGAMPSQDQQPEKSGLRQISSRSTVSSLNLQAIGLEGKVVVCDAESGCTAKEIGPADSLIQSQYLTDFAGLVKQQFGSVGELSYTRKRTLGKGVLLRETIGSWKFSPDSLICSKEERHLEKSKA